jgi:excisionase family DNA binding protein
LCDWLTVPSVCSGVSGSGTVNAWKGEISGRLLTVAEVAKILRTSERFPRRLIAERRIEFIRIGRHVRISDSALAEFIRSGTVAPMTLRRNPIRRA